ncbi:hypothetical protein [Phaeovulum sp.]|uniref:hypothetical protein n=1 Tax=Phaeovulum sp. TaxID=2934796 RepID=UPI0027309DFC|nr:hypothetical protein [Phaeovulum sp.]MDP1669672.1 hypothetical protein [Phaeovulum sp.]MDZ4117864.1 hypothetical protein [Phaeovulum sp.]
MKGMSEREYSAHSGLSRGAVQKAKKTSRLVLFADGSINATASDARYRDLTHPGKARADGVAQASGSADPSAFLKARTVNEVVKAQRAQMRLAKERGELVDRARAEMLVFRLARQERDAWVTWPSRVAALMAAEVALGMEKQTGTPVIIEAAILQRVLEAHVRQHLDALADLRVSLG